MTVAETAVGLCWVVCGGDDGTTGDHGRTVSEEKDTDDGDGGRT